MNYNEREQIIFKEDYNPSNYPCGTRSFKSVDLKTVKELIDKGFLNVNDAQNASPTAGEFYEFMEEHPEFEAHGYCVCPERSDCRVTLEGIQCSKKVSKEAMEDFLDLCRHADELSYKNGGLYCWWD